MRRIISMRGPNGLIGTAKHRMQRAAGGTLLDQLSGIVTGPEHSEQVPMMITCPRRRSTRWP